MRLLHPDRLAPQQLGDPFGIVARLRADSGEIDGTSTSTAGRV